jgi:hypothetical protein
LIVDEVVKISSVIVLSVVTVVVAAEVVSRSRLRLLKIRQSRVVPALLSPRASWGEYPKPYWFPSQDWLASSLLDTLEQRAGGEISWTAPSNRTNLSRLVRCGGLDSPS